MPALISRVREWWRCRRTAVQFFRFAIVGGINFFLDNGVYLALTRGFVWWSEHILLAAAVSFVLSVISSFLLNTFWTFSCDAVGWQRRAGKFFAVATGGLAINILLIHLAVSLGVYDLIAKVSATFVVLAWNFVLQKKWTFRD
ncbi:MAG: GtrA family protein [Patescibacteria group bacterium]